MRIKLFLLISSLLIASQTAAAEIAVGTFSSSDLSGWTDKPFKGKTSYSLATDDGRTVLKAHSRHGASGLVRKMKVDTRNFPILRWSWKVERSNPKEDVTKKSGDDFAARVYVIFPRTFFWRMRAVNYVWASKMPKGSHAPSPYTSNAVILAVESGDEKAGQWVTEERNIYEDYRKIFGEEPPIMGGVAVMTDTDDTGEESTAYYGDISLHSQK